MNDDIYNERRECRKIENIILKKKSLWKESQLLHIKAVSDHYELESTSRSISSQKEKFASISKMIKGLNIKLKKGNTKPCSEEEVNKIKVRKDNFGNEIKKGGKQKIIFKDNLEILDSLKEIDSIKKIKNLDSKSFDEYSFPKLKSKSRSSTPKISRAIMMKNIYNIFSVKNYKIKNGNPLVNIIDVECIKEETKYNTYTIKNHIINAEEEQVCCSFYCNIY